MRLVFEVPDDLHARFKAETAALGVKQAAVIRNLIDSWVQTQESGLKPAESLPNASVTVPNAAEPTLSRDEVLRRLRSKK